MYVYGAKSIMHEKIRLAGGSNAIKDEFSMVSPEISREYLLRQNPDVIMGPDLATFEKEVLNNYPELAKLSAWQNKRIYKLNADLATRPSPRFIASVTEMRAILAKAYPKK